MKIHELKTLPEFYQRILNRQKTFEVRYNDRNFQVGDHLNLREYNGRYTGRSMTVQVKYLTDYEQKPGFVVMAIHRLVTI